MGFPFLSCIFGGGGGGSSGSNPTTPKSQLPSAKTKSESQVSTNISAATTPELSHEDKLMSKANKLMREVDTLTKPNPKIATGMYENAANLYREAKSHKKAKEALEKASKAQAQLQQYYYAAQHLESAAVLAKELGNWTEVAHLYTRTSKLYHQHGLMTSFLKPLIKGAESLSNVAPDVSFQLYTELFATLQEEEDYQICSQVYGNAIKLYIKLGKYTDAAALFVKLAHDGRKIFTRSNSYLSAIILYLYAQDFNQAERCYKDSFVGLSLKGEHDDCASELVAAYKEAADCDEIKSVVQKCSGVIDPIVIMLANELPTSGMKMAIQNDLIKVAASESQVEISQPTSKSEVEIMSKELSDEDKLISKANKLRREADKLPIRTWLEGDSTANKYKDAANLYRAAKYYKKAKEAFEKASKVQENHSLLLCFAAQHLESAALLAKKLGNWTEAADLYRKTSRLKLQNGEVNSYLSPLITGAQSLKDVAPDVSMQLYTEFFAIFEEEGDYRIIHTDHDDAIQFYIKCDKYTDAAALYTRCSEKQVYASFYTRCGAYVSAIILYLYAQDLNQAETCYNNYLQNDDFLGSDSNDCARKLLAAYRKDDADQIKLVVQKNVTRMSLNPMIRRLAEKLPTLVESRSMENNCRKQDGE